MGTQLPSPKKGQSPPEPPIFGPFLLSPNGWVDQGGTWHGGRPQPSNLVMLDGDPTPPQKGGGARSPIFGKFLLCPNGWMHHYATWYGCWHQPRRLCVRWRPSPSSPTNGAEPPPNFRPISIVPKRLDASKCQSVWR